MTMSADVTELRDGVRIHVAHDESDSLAIIEVRHGHGTITIRSGLRGNLTAHDRPIRWVSHSMDAPLVGLETFKLRMHEYKKRHGLA